MSKKTILLLAGPGESTHIVFNALNRTFGIDNVILEEKEGKVKYIKRRIRRLGYIKVAGQLLFHFFVLPVLRRGSSERIKSVHREYHLGEREIPEEKIFRVSSVNEKEAQELIKTLQPAVIVVNGTRIISKQTLSVINCPIINMHTGITPAYRGVHGAYWALVKKDIKNCGVTIHKVDPGIDTGGVLYQGIISPVKQDNFITYPHLQLAKGINLLEKAVQDALDENLKTISVNLPSRLWTHPTIWEYIYNRLVKKVK